MLKRRKRMTTKRDRPLKKRRKNRRRRAEVMSKLFNLGVWYGSPSKERLALGLWRKLQRLRP